MSKSIPKSSRPYVNFHLSLTGIATLLNKMNRPDVVVAVDGSLYRFHPHFHDLMVEKITDLVNPGIKVRILYCSDNIIYLFIIFW